MNGSVVPAESQSRTSDRTMVGHDAAALLVGTQTTGPRTGIAEREPRSRKVHESRTRGRMPTGLSPPCGKGGVFSLGIPFYRTRLGL
jgi:hypothetical protein